MTSSSPCSLASALAYYHSPVEFPRIPALSQKDFGSTSTASLWVPFPFPNPKSLVSPATAGKKIVSSISQPQSCASQLRRFASRPTSSLASLPALPLPTNLVSSHSSTRFKARETKGKITRSPTLPPDSLFPSLLRLFPSLFLFYLFICSPLAKLAQRETGI